MPGPDVRAVRGPQCPWAESCLPRFSGPPFALLLGSGLGAQGAAPRPSPAPCCGPSWRRPSQRSSPCGPQELKPTSDPTPLEQAQAPGCGFGASTVWPRPLQPLPPQAALRPISAVQSCSPSSRHTSGKPHPGECHQLPPHDTPSPGPRSASMSPGVAQGPGLQEALVRQRLEGVARSRLHLDLHRRPQLLPRVARTSK